ncbi:hypothetical protein DCAR_0314288 [Daucus carota subsp. sativus]|uniref:Reverse transcriptase Ty1/copia-type domain-containing protein n=1 Tax=Daucus carota subsp. sativus TaxID=79200 RepID=A0AAF0WRV6_DAUCS|nr:hypothetical protein DCAR_0314288 [Daucus carota subsp. sativus]
MTDTTNQQPMSGNKSSFHPALAVSNIRNHIPIILEMENGQYSTWAELFKITARSHKVLSHIIPPATGKEKVLSTEDEKELWSTLDATVLSWIYATISNDLLHTIIEPDATAMEAWNRLRDIFQDNKNSRVVTLEAEFSSTKMENFPNDAMGFTTVGTGLFPILAAPPWMQGWSAPPCPFPTQGWTQPRSTGVQQPQPGVLGPRPQQAFTGTTVGQSASFVPTDIESAMHTMTLNQPDPSWYMDTGATSHMTSSNGNFSHKARLVGNGKTQLVGIDCGETFSSVVKPATIRTVLSLSLSNGWSIHQLDVKNAFLHGDLKETIYMHQPLGYRDRAHPDYVCLLRKSIYGLRQSPRTWSEKFADFVLSIGFIRSKCDTSLFVYRNGSHMAYILVYVDDIILTASSDDLRVSIIKLLSSEFAMKDLGPLSSFLGISVTRHKAGMFLSQKNYAQQIIERAGMSSCKSSPTPVDTKAKVSASVGSVFENPSLYRICLHMHDPRVTHMQALKRIIRYIQGTQDYGLHLYSSSQSSLVSYTDADWGGCPDTRRSTSGYCVFLGDNLISWSSKRQPTLSKSSAEAEYRGVANVVSESCWLRNLLLELHCPVTKATVVYCDNVSAIYLSGNPVQHQRTKHIEMDIHFVREKVARGEVRVLHVPSRYQVADIFTKGLPRVLFEDFRDSLSVRLPPASTEGVC